jgi:Predicted integral membrane protein (DUF2269)
MMPLNRSLRVLHFVGLALVLGCLFGRFAVAMLPGAADDAQTLIFTRRVISHLTRALLGPGLALLLITGVWMTLSTYGGFFGRRWLTMHQFLGLHLVVGALLILQPLTTQLLELAQGLQQHRVDPSLFQKLAREEMTFGVVGVVLALATMAVAIYKPTLPARAPRGKANSSIRK